MTSPFPPQWAARVWVEGSTIYVDCPMGDDLPSHRLSFPCDANGMQRLQTLLRHRGKHSVLGTKGDMTQHRVDADIKLLKRKIDPDKPVKVKAKDSFTAPMRQAARDVMRRFGL